MNGQQGQSEYQRKVAWLKRYQESLRAERSLLEEIEALRTEAARVTQALTGTPGSGDGQRQRSASCGRNSELSLAQRSGFCKGVSPAAKIG